MKGPSAPPHLIVRDVADANCNAIRAPVEAFRPKAGLSLEVRDRVSKLRLRPVFSGPKIRDQLEFSIHRLAALPRSVPQEC